MIYFFQFCFYSLFFFFKLYFLFDKHIIFSSYGEKLRKYISIQKNITCNLNYKQKKQSLILGNKLLSYISPYWYKQVFFTLLVSIDILVLKVSVSYRFLYSNVLFINFFKKYIEISSVLKEKYIYFKILYYLFFYILIFNIIYKIYSLILKNKEKVKKSEIIELPKLELNIAKMENQIISINETSLYQNILITGSIGAGKTSGAIDNIFSELIKNKIGGLVIDIKGDYINKVKSILKKYNRLGDLVEISLTNNYLYNPLNDNNLSSSELANVIKRVLEILSISEKNSDPFWLDKSESYIASFITLIKAYKSFISFDEIHRLVLDNKYLEEKLIVIKNRILSNEFNEKDLFNINNAIVNIKEDYMKLDERTFAIIRSEITRMTSAFLSDHYIYRKFCSKGNKIDFLSNKVYVVSLDISSNNKLSKIIATYIKLQFQRQILKNNKNITSFFMCDEYQEICNHEDANFFSLSRQYKCINIISMQSYSSLVNKLKDEYVSNVIIQNFINKIWFRNDDMYTVKSIISQLGKMKFIQKSKMYGENGKNIRISKVLNKFVSYNSDISESYSETESIQNKFNEEFFTQDLKTFEAMCFISDGNEIKIYEKVKFKRLGEM